MRVLVTGSQGYIGSVLMPMLAQHGIAAVGLDAGWFQRGTVSGDGLGISHWQADIREVQCEDLEEFDVVMHLAGVSCAALSCLNPSATFEINHRATLRLAGLARQAGVERFIFASSCELYGAAGDDLVDESGKPCGDSPLTQSLALAERELASLAGDSFSPVVLRCATACGPSPRLRLDLSLNRLVAVAMTRGRIPIAGDGSAWHSLVHVEDICLAFIAAAGAPREAIHNRVFNIGRCGETYRLRELAEMVTQVVGGASIEFDARSEQAPRSLRVDFTKAATELPGFFPRWSARGASAQLSNAIAQRAIDIADVEGSGCFRLSHIQELVQSGQLDDSLRWTCAAVARTATG